MRFAGCVSRRRWSGIGRETLWQREIGKGGAKKALTYDDRLVIEQGPLNCLGVEKARPGDVNLALLPFQDGCKIMR